MKSIPNKLLATLFVTSLALAACSKETPSEVPIPPETVSPSPALPTEPVPPATNPSEPTPTPPADAPVTPAPANPETEAK